jgi:hypothetical protein
MKRGMMILHTHSNLSAYHLNKNQPSISRREKRVGERCVQESLPWPQKQMKGTRWRIRARGGRSKRGRLLPRCLDLEVDVLLNLQIGRG